MVPFLSLPSGTSLGYGRGPPADRPSVPTQAGTGACLSFCSRASCIAWSELKPAFDLWGLPQGGALLAPLCLDLRCFTNSSFVSTKQLVCEVKEVHWRIKSVGKVSVKSWWFSLFITDGAVNGLMLSKLLCPTLADFGSTVSLGSFTPWPLVASLEMTDEVSLSVLVQLSFSGTFRFSSKWHDTSEALLEAIVFPTIKSCLVNCCLVSSKCLLPTMPFWPFARSLIALRHSSFKLPTEMFCLCFFTDIPIGNSQLFAEMPLYRTCVLTPSSLLVSVSSDTLSVWNTSDAFSSIMAHSSNSSFTSVARITCGEHFTFSDSCFSVFTLLNLITFV